MPNIYKFNIGSDFVLKAVTGIEDFMESSEASSIRIALSGGSSPIAVYEKLAASQKIDWSRIEIYQVDERSDHSNEEMIREALIAKLSDLKAFHPFDKNYEKKIQALPRPFFHLVLLGLGEDGHTASIFPHSSAVEEIEALTLKTESPTGVKERITLSFPAILSSEKIIFLIRGAGKKEILSRWLSDEGSEMEIPAKVILDHPDVDVYYDYSQS
ncbi:MAG: 6-phosphogluconolactonase [Candidatus Peregrinibacteria bacterium]|nr:6-phosphogluconolactonase [Candidatus Peregrinibacteria bacterium]